MRVGYRDRQHKKRPPKPEWLYDIIYIYDVCVWVYVIGTKTIPYRRGDGQCLIKKEKSAAFETTRVQNKRARKIHWWEKPWLISRSSASRETFRPWLPPVMIYFRFIGLIKFFFIFIFTFRSIGDQAKKSMADSIQPIKFFYLFIFVLRTWFLYVSLFFSPSYRYE